MLSAFSRKNTCNTIPSELTLKSKATQCMKKEALDILDSLALYVRHNQQNLKASILHNPSKDLE